MIHWNKFIFNFFLNFLLGMLPFTILALNIEERPTQTHAFANPSIHDQGRGKLLFHLAGEWISRTLYVATKLEIADHLQQGPKSIKELAHLTQAHPESLHRLLRLLVSIEIFQEDEEGVFSNNQASSLLAKNHSMSLHALTLFYGEEMHPAWSELLNSIKLGTPAFEIVCQQPVFAYFKDHPTSALLFQEAMKEKSKAIIQSALNAYNFSPFQTVYDIGAGHGQFIQAILNRYSHLKGIVFDLPEVIETLSEKNPDFPKSRCQMVAGDFFLNIPIGGDIYILKSILHDWDDDNAIKILKNCSQAMSSNSRLLIVEAVLLPKQQAVYAKCMDVLMLAITGGKERTLAAFENILQHAGFKIEMIYPTSTEFSIIEVRKAKS